MSTKPIRILLVEDNPGDARLIREMLASAQDFSIEWVSRLADGLEQLDRGRFDVVLLDLGLPDSQGLDTLVKAHEQVPQVPFVVLTGLADENLAVSALRKGAQDYLFKDETHPTLILRAIRYATERKQAELALETERRKLFGVLNNLPAFVHLKGADFIIKFANRRYRDLYGEPGDKPCYETLRGLSKPCDDCHMVEVFRTRTPQRFEWTDPQGRIFEVHHYPFCPDGEYLILTLGIDITERKRAEAGLRDSEEQLATIYDNAPLIMMLLDVERRVTKANKMAQECAGTDEAHMVGRRGGEALRCLQSLDDPEGCGFGPYCQACLVRSTVIDTLEKGVSHHQVEASLPFDLDGHPREVTFLLSTARLFLRGEPQALITIQDITKRKETREALRQSEENLRYLASQLLNAQERERLRIAHELHDDLGQSLLLLKLQLGGIARELPAEAEAARLQCLNAIDSVQDIVDSVRCLSQDLVPPALTEIGLKSALKDLIEEFCRHYGVTGVLDIDEVIPALSPDAALIIFRIVQESLTNIGKYSKATEVCFSLKVRDGQVWLAVEDNGAGFDIEEVYGHTGRQRGLGLTSMEERARMLGGTFKIGSKPGMGTRIQVAVPFSKRD